MKLDAFSNHDDGFAILNFRAEFQWKTSASISFMLCQRTAPNVRRGFGWLDVHETSDEWRRIKMRICLDHNYIKFADCQTMVKAICENLDIPNDSYEATFISPLKQFSYDTGCDHEFVSYGPPNEPDDNPWDDRNGVSPLDVITRETAFGMILAAFPDFHRRIDKSERSRLMKDLGEQFLDFGETFELADAIEFAANGNEENQLRRLFDLLEKLAIFGDDYTRNASLVRLFELLQQRKAIADKLKPLMLPATIQKWDETAAEITKWGNNAVNRSGEGGRN